MKKMTERKKQAKNHTSLARVESKLDDIVKQLSVLDNRLEAVEERIKLIVSPFQQPPTLEPHELPYVGDKSLSPAMQQTLSAVKDLARDPKTWVSTEDVAKITGRSTQTESAYLKYLSKTGPLNRRPQLRKIAGGRRVRRWLYRSRE